MKSEEGPKFVALGPFRPIDDKLIGEQTKISLTKRKKQYLDGFIKHYCQKTRQSKEKTIQYRKKYADQRAVSFFHLSLKELCYPLWNAKAYGSKIYDIDGNEYVDIALDFGISIFGHQPEFVKKAIEEQLNKGWAIGMRPAKSAIAIEKLCIIAKMDRAVFCQSGTEAVMTAVRLARHVSKKRKVVIFSNSYHGQSDGLLAFPNQVNGKNMAKPITDGITPGAVEELVILEYCNPQSLKIIESMKTELAAVVAEPVQSRGIQLNPQSFLKELREITQENGIALIFDEMIMGFRAAPAGVQDYYEVRPDMATYGKIVGGGLCIGAVTGRAKYLNAIDGGIWNYGDMSYPTEERTFFAGTHCQNALAMAAADAVLTRLLEEGEKFQEGLNAGCKDMCNRINGIFEKQQVGIRAFYFGSLFRFEAVGKLNSLDMNLFLYHLRDNGVMVSEVGNNFLSSAHTDIDIEKIVDAVDSSICNMKLGGYF